jgi:regulator of telomere elongation helicase 1
MKKRAKAADIIFMPYNYLIDPDMRSRLKIEMRNKIILIDEAHNIAKSAESAYSHKITTN